MKTYIQKWGNSLGVRIPAAYAKELQLRTGTLVEIYRAKDKIVIVPRKKTLDDLLSHITPENTHEPVETGVSLGEEEW